MGSSVNVALPTIGREFGLDAVALNWTVTAYLLAAGMFLLPFGRLSDIKGRKRVFLAGLGVYSLFSLAIPFAANGAWLVGLRFTQGMGGAMIFGTGMTILVSVYPAEERGRVLGMNVASVYLGGAVGPFLGGLLTQHLGWRSIFWLNAALGILVVGFVGARLKGEWAEARAERFDGMGAALYGTALLLLMYGFSLLPRAQAWPLVAGGAGGLAAFTFLQLRSASPLLDIRLFGDRTFLYAAASALINYSATFAVGFLLSLYLQYVKGLTPSAAGSLLLVQPVIQSALSPAAGRLADRRDPQAIAAVGMGLCAAGLVVLALLRAGTHLAVAVAALVLLGLGFAFFSSPNTSAAMGAVARRSYGVASSVMGTMRLLGQMLSMGVTMVVFAVLLHGVQVTPAHFREFLLAVRLVFGMSAALCVLGVFLRTVPGRASRGPRSPTRLEQTRVK